MDTTTLLTKSLKLVLDTPESTRTFIASMSAEQKAQLSADWLLRVEAATSPDPWVHGFSMVLQADDTTVGSCGFKGPPTDGAVEIAYGVEPEHQGKGYATEAAAALLAYALRQSDVKIVRAHTLPETNSSTRVLTKCGFKKLGEVIDSEDGLVWRWEVELVE